MSDNRRNLVVVSIKAENENDLQAKLFDLSLETAKMPDIITIYPKGSYLYAWVRVERNLVELTSAPEKKLAKKAKAKIK